MENITWQDEVKDLIKSTGKTMTEVAELTEVPYRTLQHWKGGDREPSNLVKKAFRKAIESLNNVVINSYGDEIYFNSAVGLMDDEIREDLHMSIAPCTNQEFFDAYCKAHAEKYGEAWLLDCPNPTY